MTDTGQVPGEGLPENAGAQPEQQPVVPAASGAYTYADPGESPGGAPAEDEDQLLMPGAQGAWSDAQVAAAQQNAHVPGSHESDGRDSGSIDYGAVRTAHAAPPESARPRNGQAPAAAPRRPLHLGPPVPEQSGAVRSLADRGPSAAPTAAPGASPASEAPAEPAAQVEQQATGLEYLDVAQQVQDAYVGPQLADLPGPSSPEAWAAPAPQHAEGAHAGPMAEPPLPGPDLAAVPDTAVPDPAVPDTAVPDPAAVPPPAVADGTPQASVPDDPATQQPAAPRPAPRPAPAPDGPVPAAAGQAGEPGTPEGTQPETVPAAQPTPPAPVTAEDAAAGAPADTAPQPNPAQGGLPVEPPAGPGSAADSLATAGAAAQQPQPSPADRTPAVGTVTAPQEIPDGPQEPPGTPAGGTEVGDISHGGSETAPVSGPEAPAESVADAVQAPAPEPAPEPAPQPQPAPEPAVAERAESFPQQRQPGTPATVPAPATAMAEEADVPPAPTGAAPEGATGAVAPQETTPPVNAEPQADPQAGSINEDGPAAPAAPSPDGVPPHETDSAAAAARGDAAPGYDQAEREAVHRLMRERRDIRKGFRPDPIPHDVLLRVLEAAHTAPSVGHSQPWDFVVIRSEETRRTMHELAQRQRAAYAKSLPKARAKQFKELKVEAILDTPVNILVTADPTRGGRHTLGRHTQPQMAPYSSALAVENLWLAARAEGLGVGWVSFFDEREMVRTLDLPEHLEAVAYLCIGYVDEFPDEPELMQAGWSKRRPLSWVVHEESYGRRALPGAEPHDLLAETLEGIRPLDAKALGEAWERQKRMTKPAGALGMLEIISAQLCGLSRQCPPPIPEPAAVAIFAGDHGVHAQGVTPWPQEVTAQMVANFLGGGAVCNAFANQVGAEVCVIDVGVVGELPAAPGLLPRKVRAGTADMTQGPALTREEVLRALEVGIETARDLVAAGNKALVTGEMGIANTTASAALIAVCTGTDPAEVTGRGTGINDETHARKVEVVRQALQLHRPDPADPIGLLAAVGGLEHAALAGLILGGASLRTPVILDGVSAGAAALVARQIAPEALAACVAGHRSAEPGHLAALTKLGLRPLVDLDLRLGEGTGALLALPLVQSAARAMHEVATFDSAGVTEKG